MTSRGIRTSVDVLYSPSDHEMLQSRSVKRAFIESPPPYLPPPRHLTDPSSQGGEGGDSLVPPVYYQRDMDQRSKNRKNRGQYQRNLQVREKLKKKSFICLKIREKLKKGSFLDIH